MATERPQSIQPAGERKDAVRTPSTGDPESLGTRLLLRAREAGRRFAQRRARVASAAAAVAALTLIWTALIVRDLQVQIATERAAAQHSLETVTEVGVHAMELAVRGADMLLIDLRDEWENHRWHFPGLVQMRQAHPAIGFDFDITVLGPDGRVELSSVPAQRGMDLSQIPLFPRLRNATADVLSVSAVRVVEQRPVMELARRLTLRDGTFSGVVICSVPADYLRSQFADVALEPRTTLTAVRDDGRVLVQLTSGPGRTLADSSPGSRSMAIAPASRELALQKVSLGDDAKPQLIAWRKAHGYPFTFVVTRPSESLDTAVARLRWRYGAAATLLSVALLLGLWRLVRHEELRERAAREQADHVRALTQAQSALAASERELRQLSSHNLAVKEAEHRRVAREIHDELGQRLTVHRMDLAMLPRTLRNKPEREVALRVAAMKSDVDAMLAIARDVARQLRPGALDIGLAPAVESMLHDVQTRLAVRCDFDNRLPPDFTTDDTRATTAFRIVQEAVTNAVRHANPGCITVALDRAPDCLLLRVQDDGSGFDQAAQRPGFGLGGMRERAQALGGVVRIRSTPHAGTMVEAEIPLHGDIEHGTRIPTPQPKMQEA